MSPFDFCRSTTINETNFNLLNAGNIHKQQECLDEVRPLLEQPVRTPSPPTNNTFTFPSLLECLANQPPHTLMPRFHIYEDDSDTPPLIRIEQSDPEFPLSQMTENPMKTNPLVRKGKNSSNVVNDSNREGNTMDPDAYSLRGMIEEARAHYDDKTPPFCVTTNEHTTRQVRLSGTETQVEINFQDWNDKSGYWTLTDNAGDEYIVKCTGSKYCSWEGVDKGFSKEPVAYTPTASQNRPPRLRSESTQPSDGPSPNASRSLRPRTTVQTKPYTVYNAQKKYDRKGMRLSSAQLEEVVEEQIATRTTSTKAKATTITANKRRKINDKSSPGDSIEDGTEPMLSGVESSSSTLDIPDTTHIEHASRDTILRTRLSGFGLASIPLKATECNSSELLFAEMKKRWTRQLAHRQIAYCIVMFPWLSEDKSILLEEVESDSFDFMMEELRSAPMLKGEHRIEVIIEIHAE